MTATVPAAEWHFERMLYPLPSYLRSLRKKRALSQRELGKLLGGLSASAVSKYERLERRPTAKVLIACEIIFEERISEVYPILYGKVGASIRYRAERLLDELGDTEGPTADAKRRVLRDLLSRLHEGESTNTDT